MLALLRRFVDVRDEEMAALLWSFLYFFALLAGWYVMRPLRDEMGVTAGSRNMPWLFSGTFIAMLVVVPIYSLVVSRVPRRRLVPLVYHFFALNLVGFFLFWRLGVVHVLTAQVFFIWTSVYNLFVVSVGWSVMADTWRSDQGQRLYGFIAAGGSAGAILGPLVTTALVGVLGPAWLVLLSAGLLEIAVLCVTRLGRAAEPAPAPATDADRVGGGAWAGFKNTLASPYLLLLAACVLLYTVTSTFLYSEQTRLFETLIPDRAARTRIFGLQDMAVNIASVALQAGLFGRVMAVFGLGATLAVVPAVTAAGFGALLVAPAILVVAIFQALRRALHFGLDRPAREVLFTVVPREDKYKAKSFIDTVVYRGGDAGGAWLFAALGALAMPAAVPLALIWLVAVLALARRHAARQGDPA